MASMDKPVAMETALVFGDYDVAAWSHEDDVEGLDAEVRQRYREI